MLSRTGFRSSRRTGEVPHFPGPVRRVSLSLSILTSHHLFIPGRPLVSQPALKLTYFSNVTTEGKVPNHSVGPPLSAPLPAHCSASSGLAPSCHSLSLMPPMRISSHGALSSVPGGPCSTSASILCCYPRVTKYHPSFPPTFLSSLLFVCLSLPAPGVSFSLGFSSFSSLFSLFLRTALLTIISL